jgi:hypothetical protein
LAHRLTRLAAGIAAVLAIAVGTAVVANAASNGGGADNPAQQQPSTIDVRPVQQSGSDSGSDDGPGRGPGRPPCHHHGGSGGNGSGNSGSTSGSSGSSGQI